MEQQRTRKKINGLVVTAMAFVALFLVLPLIFVVVQALREGVSAYVSYITEEYAVKALILTLQTTVVAVAVNTVFGLFAAWTVTKYTIRGSKLLTSAMDLPLSVTPDLIPVLSAQGRDEEEAAALMGAGWLSIFKNVTFPHIKWPLLYGIVLCTARAMGEFGAVSILSGHLRGKTNTLPLHIEILYNEFHYTQAFAVSSILVMLAVLVLILRSVIEHRGRKKEM